MNRDEISKVHAGREMDMLIAVEVMGWRVDAETAYSPSGSANARQVEMGEPWLPYYSTDMSDAWMVMEKMESHPDEILLSLSRHGTTHENLVWGATFRECRGQQKDFYFEANTAPLAICRAALLTNKKAE